VIQKDMAITSRILRIANSAYYGIPRKIDNLKTALVVLGISEISRLVTSFSMMNMFQGNENFDMKQFWLHGAACADLNVGLFNVLRLRCPASAHVVGLLHDVGKILLLKYLPEYYNQCVSYMNKNNIKMVDAEVKILGIDHGHIGSWLTKKWDIPEEISDAIAQHHIRPPDVAKFSLPLVTDWADRLYYIFQDRSEEESIEFMKSDTDWNEWHDGRISNREVASKNLYMIYERSSLLISFLS